MKNIHPIFDRLVSRAEREKKNSHKAAVYWLTGLSGSGKSTIAVGAERILFDKGFQVKVLDGDNTRTGLCNNLGFSLEDRQENIRRIAEVGRLFVDTGIICLASFVSPTIEIRAMARDIIGADDFVEVFVNTPLEECEKRDVKGLYKKARAGEIKGFTGIDSPYETPLNADLIINTMEETVEKSVQRLVEFIERRSEVEA